MKSISEMSANNPEAQHNQHNQSPNPLDLKFQAPALTDFTGYYKNFQNTAVRGPGMLSTVYGNPAIGTNTYLDYAVGANRATDVYTKKFNYYNPECVGCPLMFPKLANGDYYDPGKTNQTPPGGSWGINVKSKNTPNATAQVKDAITIQAQRGSNTKCELC
jgi:hypothetical protein